MRMPIDSSPSRRTRTLAKAWEENCEGIRKLVFCLQEWLRKEDSGTMTREIQMVIALHVFTSFLFMLKQHHLHFISSSSQPTDHQKSPRDGCGLLRQLCRHAVAGHGSLSEELLRIFQTNSRGQKWQKIPQKTQDMTKVTKLSSTVACLVFRCL